MVKCMVKNRGRKLEYQLPNSSGKFVSVPPAERRGLLKVPASSTPTVLSVDRGVGVATNYKDGFDEECTYGTFFFKTPLAEVERIIDEIKAGHVVREHKLVEWPGVVEIAPV